MADRSLATRLRTSGGPSEELLVLLDVHRVLTSGQLARLTGAPQRTVTYRLDRLLAERMVKFDRPGREVGSAPRHWWLTAKGARHVAGVAPAEGKKPSGMFAAHASAIAEVWLAVLEHGPAAGITGRGWWPDRAGWYTLRHAGDDVTLSPDGVLLAELSAGQPRPAGERPSGPAGSAFGPAGPAAGMSAAVPGQAGGQTPVEAVAFVEVDLATMSQSKLREKVDRYLDYAEERQWDGRWPHCPPLLLLTTTHARAVTFLRAAAKVAAKRRRHRGLDYRFRGYGRAGRDVAAAERLVIAACGHVRNPAAAVAGPVWLLAPDPAGDADAGDLVAVDLAGLLRERVAAQQVADDWYARIDADVAANRRAATLAELALARGGLAELLADEHAAAAYRHLAHGDSGAFTAAHPDLARQAYAWWTGRGTAGDDGRRTQLVAVLTGEYERLYAEQIRTLLAAPRTAAGHPKAAAAAAALQNGQLLDTWALGELAKPVTDTREQLQQQLLTDYHARRDTAVDTQLRTLGRWARRRADPAADAAAYDEQHLLVCDVCAIAVPDPDDPGEYGGDDGVEDWLPGPHRRLHCDHCGTGQLIAYADRGQVPTLDDRLTQLRTRLSR